MYEDAKNAAMVALGEEFDQAEFDASYTGWRTADDVLANVTNPELLSNSPHASDIAASAIAQANWTKFQNGQANVQLPQQLWAARANVEDDDQSEVQALVEQYFGDAEKATQWWTLYINSSANARKRLLEELAHDASDSAKAQIIQDQRTAETLVAERAEVLGEQYDDLFIATTQAMDSNAGSARNDDVGRGGKFTDEQVELWRSGHAADSDYWYTIDETTGQRVLDREKVIAAGRSELDWLNETLNNGFYVDSTGKQRSVREGDSWYQGYVERRDRLQAALADVESASADYQAVLTLSTQETADNLTEAATITEDVFDFASNITSMSDIADKGQLDTAEEWRMLEDATGMSYKDLQAKFAGSDALDWGRFIKQTMTDQLGKMKTQEEVYQMTSTDREAFFQNGGRIVTQEERDEYQAKIDDTWFLTLQTSVSDLNEGLDDSNKSATEFIKTLSGFDVTKDVEEGTQAYIDLANALDAAGISMEDFLALSDVEQIKALGEAQKSIYDDQIARYDQKIKNLQALRYSATTDAEREAIDDEIAQIEEDRLSAIRNKEAVDTATASSVNTQLTQEYSDLNKELSEIITNADKAYKLLKGINLDTAPKKGTQAYAELQKQIEGAYDSVEDFYKASQEAQIKFLGQKKGELLLSEYQQYSSLLEDAEQKRQEAIDSGADDKAISEWDSKITTLEQKKADAWDAYVANDEAWQQELAKYYQSLTKLAEQSDKKLQTKLSEQESRVKTLAGSITSGELTLAQRQGQTGIENWDTMSVADRRKLVMGQYSALVNSELDFRDTKLSRYTNASAALGQGSTAKNANGKNLFSLLAESTGPISKEAFTDLLSQVDLSPELKGILEDAWDESIKSLDPDKFSQLSWSDVGALLQSTLQEAMDSADEDCSEKIASIKDEMISVYATLSEQELQLAENAVAAWEQAFKKIASLRKSILMGEDITSDLTSSLEDFTTYLDAYGGDIEALLADYKAGTLKSTQFTLGTPEEYAAKEKSALGIDKLFYRNQNGTLAQLKGQTSLGRTFGIDQEQFYTRDENNRLVYDTEAYETALHNAVNPYLTALLEAAGYTDPNEITRIIAGYWSGAPEAVKAVEDAGKKMDKSADAYGQLVATEQKITEAKAERDKIQSDQNEIATKANDKYNITHSVRTGRNASSITQLTNDVDRDDYLRAVNAALKAAGFKEISSITDMENWDITDERWNVISSYFEEAAIKAKGEIVEAGIRFKEIVTGEGYGSDSAIGQEAEEFVDTASADVSTTANSYASQNQDSMQSILDSTSTRQSAVYNAVNLDSSASWQDRINTAQALREAYIDADAATQAWAESMAQAVEAGEDLSESNKALTTANLRVGKSYSTMTKQQRAQYKEMLKTNKVTVDGYETLEEYFDVLDSGAAIYDSIMDAADKFEDQGIDSVTEVLGEDMDEAKEGFQAGTEEMEDLLTTLLPDMFDNVAPQLLELSSKYSGDVNAALNDGWDTTIDGFNANTIALLEAMGLSADQIIALQDETRARIAEGASLGSIDFLSVMANMDIDPTQFDSMVTALNAAMHQIEAMLQANGMTLDPPWTDIPTLGSKGIGGGRGSSGSTGKDTSSSGGGGGDSAKKVQTYKKGEDEKERYHEITKQLDEQSKQLSKLEKIKERAFGADKLKAINEEIAALEKENDLYADLASQASVNLEANKRILEGYGATFNEDGTINYEEYMDKILAQYNAAVDRYNASDQDAGDELALKEAEEIYNEAKKAMENYEEDMNKLNEAQENMLENQNKISAAMLEGIQYKVEIN